MNTQRRVLVGMLTGSLVITGISACQGVQAAKQAAAPQPAPLIKPTRVDLRPRLAELGLVPRAQGGRGTCSIFTTCEAIEFAMAQRTHQGVRLSPEYLNWAAGQAAGRPSDGNFFHNALAGFETHGICGEELMPYKAKFDAGRVPSTEAKAAAEKLRGEAKVAVRWIVPWSPNRFGVNDEQMAEIKSVLVRGYPVAAGSGHSRLLVGFVDDATQPGGGKFITEDSALARFDEVTYEFVRTQVADVFWVEAIAANQVN